MVLFQEPFPHIIIVPFSLGDIVTIQQGVPGDAVPWPGRGVAPFGVNLTIFEQDCKGPQPFAGVRGVPEILLFLFLLAAAGGERGKGTSGDTPETPAGRPCTP